MELPTVRNSCPFIGIDAVGYYIPKKKISSEEIAELSSIPANVFTEKIGFKQISVADDSEHPSEMGIKAASDALKKSKISAEDIDVIIYTGVGDYDYRFWSPAAKIQDAVKAKKSYAFEVRNACNGGNLAVYIASQLLQNDRSMRNALVVASDKWSQLINYTDKRLLSLFHIGDGAAAVLLSKDSSKNKILGYASITDGQLVDEIKIPYGGTKINNFTDPLPKKESCYINFQNPQKLDNILSEIYLKNYLYVIQTALEKTGHSAEDISFLLTNQVKASLSKNIFDSLNLKSDQTYRSITEYGHMGPVDTLFCFAKIIEENKLKNDDIVVLASSGAGFTWGATVLRH
ncbi:MAG: beta-ketoacyl-ACP reductase [Candidatus Electrothrix sp. ATG2]|nr:beta-ketoacyl-ACP reductase [Candidatus Electrothrix sp. ATG2]